MKAQLGYVCHAPAEYIVGIRPIAPDPEPTDAEIAAWRARWGATCSEKVARILCALEQEFALSSPTRGAISAPAHRP